jgi:hypothetical protein
MNARATARSFAPAAPLKERIPQRLQPNGRER